MTFSCWRGDERKLGVAPSVAAINEFMLDLGLQKRVVGQSLQGRDLLLYEHVSENDNGAPPTILFLSLVHGNEPMGLLSLLYTAKTLVSGSIRRRQASRILFFPIVNVDAYILNLETDRSGCRRTNLRSTCDRPVERNTQCPRLANDGVDLNRNFASDWNRTDVGRVTSNCSYNYGGPHPFSEPESRAVRDVVLQYNVKAAMSFHSRGRSGRTPLLIHPYTSSRSINEMPVSDARRFRDWSLALNQDYAYITGTAEEAIHYTAGGSSIDWMYSAQNITAFVVEVVPPCNNRWCEDTPVAVCRQALIHSATGRRFVQLVLHGKVMDNDSAVGYVVVLLVCFTIAWLLWKFQGRQVVSAVRKRLFTKEKNVPETELHSLIAY